MRFVTRKRPSASWSHYVSVALTCACVWACGSEEESPGHHDLLDDGGPPSIDASVRLDASDGSAPGLDGAPDADAVETVENHCRVTRDAVIAQRFFDPQGAISVAMRSRGGLLSWTQYRGGKSRVLARWLGVAAGAAEAPVVDDDANQTDVHSSATATGFLTTWSDDTGGLRARRSGDDGMVLDEAAIALTSDAGSRGSVSAQGADGKLLLAFVGATRGRTLLLGADAKPIASAQEVPGFMSVIGRPSLAALREGYVLAWVDAATRRVHLQRLDASGAPVGANQTVDSDGDARGQLDVATTGLGGAIAWDVLVGGSRAEVRLRTFDSDATPTGIEQKVTPYPESGLHPTVAAARGGYLVAYRSAQGPTLALRLVMLDARGKPVSLERGALTVASLQQQALPLAMRIADDGRHLFLGWLDQTPGTPDYQLQQAWMECD